MDVCWPLVGRESELSLIGSILGESGGAGQGLGGVLLSGGPGAGKTRLLRAAVDAAASAGHPVETVAATRAAASIPFGALFHLLSRDATATGHDPEGLEPLRLVATRLSCSWGRLPMVLAVDDAHLLDDASAALVHSLCAHGLALVVATVRSGERAPDAIVALWKDELVRRLAVRPLQDTAVDQLVDHALAGQVCGPTRAELRRLAQGNPLYLRELLVAGSESGTLRQRDGVWRWDGFPRGWERLGELVEARLGACGAAGRSVVELVACAEPLPLALLETEPGLGAAEQTGLLQVVTDGRRAVARLAEPIVGEVLRANLPPIRSRTVHRTLLARSAATPPRRRDDLLRLGAWQLAAGLRADHSVLLPAAREALARRDFELAGRLAGHAADAGSAEAVPLLAEVLHWRGHSQQAVERLSAGPPRDATPSLHAGWRAAKASSLYWGPSRRLDAVEALDAVPNRPGCHLGNDAGNDAGNGTRAGAGDDDPRTGAVRALMLLCDARCREALDAALPVLGAAGAPVASRLWAYTAGVAACTALGQTSRADRLAKRGLELATRHRGEVLLAVPYLDVARGRALLFAGRTGEARAVAEDGYAAAVVTGEAGLVAAWASLRGEIAQLQGDLRLAVAALREAVTLNRQRDPEGMLKVRLTALAGAVAMTGDAAGAAGWLARADGIATPVHRLCAPQVEANRAWVAAAGGEMTRAASLALRGAARARDADLPCLEALVLHDAARHGGADRARARLGELADRVDGGLVSACADSAAALAYGDGPRLSAAADVFARLDLTLPAAEAAVAASHAYRVTGRPRRANAALERARALAARCPDAATPAVAVGDLTAALTPREREITVLAAMPVSSPEIARRLHLSVRTVDNHLARVYSKLGVSGRVQLASLIAEDSAAASAGLSTDTRPAAGN